MVGFGVGNGLGGEVRDNVGGEVGGGVGASVGTIGTPFAQPQVALIASGRKGHCSGNTPFSPASSKIPQGTF